jgi:hypothetical protein
MDMAPSVIMAPAGATGVAESAQLARMGVRRRREKTRRILGLQR